MTFKIPEPAFWVSPDKVIGWEAVYTRAQLIQALRDWSEELAELMEAQHSWISNVAASASVRQKAKELQ